MRARLGVVEREALLAVTTLQDWGGTVAHFGVFTRADARGRGLAARTASGAITMARARDAGAAVALTIRQSRVGTGGRPARIRCHRSTTVRAGTAAGPLIAQNGTVIEVLALGSRISDVNVFAYLAAFGGGVISFLSPCVLPLVPGYLSMVTGLDLADLEESSGVHTRRIVITTASFVAGFGTVFVALGLSASSFGQLLRDHQSVLTRLSGALMFGMALFLLGSLFLQAPWLYQEKRFHPQLGRFGAAAPAVAGAAFGFGWTPCIGPILGSILGIAANQNRVWAGGTLLVAYSLGLGLPFLISGLALGRVSGALGWVKRHFPLIVGFSAVVLAGFGLLLMFDELSRLSLHLQNWLTDAHLEWLVNLG